MNEMNNRPAGPLAGSVEQVGYWVNYLTERVCGILVAAMIGVVWFGIVDRYFFALGGTWTEELARYIMIWAALLAVPCCTYRREHIGLDLLFKKIPQQHRVKARVVLDLLGLVFFIFLFYYGILMTKQGATQYATIFGMSMTIPYLSVPVTCGLTIFQIIICMARELSGAKPHFMVKEGAV